MNMSAARKSLMLKFLSSKCALPIITRSVSNRDDIVTHTGQKWETSDYRLSRFMNAPKQVNPNWAVNLIAQVPPKAVEARAVWCDGGGGPEGHPRVYINLVNIIYCNKKYLLYYPEKFQGR